MGRRLSGLVRLAHRIGPFLVPAVAPVLLSLFPILFLVSHNLRDLGLEESYVRARFLHSLRWVLAVSASGAVAAFAAFAIALRDAQKGAALASVAVLLFFTFGHAYDALVPMGIPIPLWALLGIWIMIFAGFGAWAWRSRRSWAPPAKAITVAATVLVFVSLTSIVVGVATAPAPHAAEGPAMQTSLALSLPEEPPSIYYIILDGYGSSEVLADLGYDNSPFIQSLESRNFKVEPDAHSNYAQTALSLPSTLNMRYLDPNQEFSTFSAEARDSDTLGALKSVGYRFVNFANTMYAGTINREAADTFVPCGGGTDFFRVLSQTTALRAWDFEQALYSRKQHESVMCTLDGLEHAGALPGPKFVLGHVLIPHPPYIVGPSGQRPSLSEAELRQPQWLLRDRYLDQVAYLDARMVEIVDRILAAEPRPPIIVIQGDHGPLTETGFLDEFTNESVRERMGILNAYHLPDGGDARLHEGITPVNTFRVIFGHYFNASLAPLEDRSYYSTDAAPTRFIDVTDMLQGPAMGAGVHDRSGKRRPRRLMRAGERPVSFAAKRRGRLRKERVSLQNRRTSW